MQYKVCPLCGAHLDPQERCDCEEERTAGSEILHSHRDRTNGRSEAGTENILFYGGRNARVYCSTK